MRLAKALLLLASFVPAYAAECNGTFTLDATHTSVLFDNQTHGCYFWAISYFSSGFTALSLTFEQAPNGLNSSTPGTFTTFTGFPVSFVGDNAQTAIGFSSWVRVRLASFSGTGTITGQMVGAPIGGLNVIAMGTVLNDGGTPRPIRVDLLGALLPSGGSRTTADATSPTQFVPLCNNGGISTQCFYNTFPYDFNGVTWDQHFVCTNSAPITFSAASGTLQIVGLTAAQIIRVCHVSLSSSVATDITLVYGTGSNCAGGTTSLTGAYKGVTTLALDFGPEAALRTIAANAFCVTSSAVATIGGVVSYAKY